MNDRPINPAPGNGPWRLLLGDPDPQDPKWVICLVMLPSDVRPASRYETWQQVTDWVRAQVGDAQATLTPITDALAWRIATGQPPVTADVPRHRPNLRTGGDCGSV